MRSTITSRIHVLGVLLVSGLALSVAACGSVSPSASATTVGSLASTVVSPSPTPVNLPDMSASPPVGGLLTSPHGTGGREITLYALATGSHKVAIRFACVGQRGAARLTDLSGGLLLGVSACDGRTIYGSAFASSPKDRSLRLDVEPAISWVIAVWAD